MSKGITDFLTSAGEMAEDSASSVKEFAVDTTKKTSDAIKGAYSATTDYIGGAAENVKSGTKDEVKKVEEKLSD